MTPSCSISSSVHSKRRPTPWGSRLDAWSRQMRAPVYIKGIATVFIISMMCMFSFGASEKLALASKRAARKKEVKSLRRCENLHASVVWFCTIPAPAFSFGKQQHSLSHIPAIYSLNLEMQNYNWLTAKIQKQQSTWQAPSAYQFVG